MSICKDLTGKSFGRLKVVKRSENNSRKQSTWLCKCVCGEKKVVLGSNLLRNLTKSCGCLRKEQPYADLTNKKFGRLIVIRVSKRRTESGMIQWDCKCDCGKSIKVISASLMTGNTKSCGCLKKEMTSKENNYQAKRCILNHGVWIPKKSEWYARSANIMIRVRREKIPCDFRTITEFAHYLKNISPEKCPIFNKKLKSGIGAMHDFSPSVDKIIPKKGYVKGNIQVISNLANRMKNNASPTQLKQFAHWVMKG